MKQQMQQLIFVGTLILASILACSLPLLASELLESNDAYEFNGGSSLPTTTVTLLPDPVVLPSPAHTLVPIETKKTIKVL
jgi:hypothetical protein